VGSKTCRNVGRQPWIMEESTQLIDCLIICVKNKLFGSIKKTARMYAPARYIQQLPWGISLLCLHALVLAFQNPHFISKWQGRLGSLPYYLKSLCPTAHRPVNLNALYVFNTAENCT
jgi:hypothetical protein